jgi:2,5-diketo-D-gluconate reductase B
MELLRASKGKRHLPIFDRFHPKRVIDILRNGHIFHKQFTIFDCMDESPRIGLGTYKNTDPEQCADIVSSALELGYRHVDTAQAYDNESHVGDGIERADIERDDVFLATKVWDDKLAYDDVHSSIHDSLDKLGVERLDLLYVHWPRNTYDAEETLPAFDELHDEGTIEHVGLSNFTPEQLDEARDVLDAPIFAHQIEMHPLLQQDELHEYAREDDHWLVAYAPIARGEVTDIDEIQEVAKKHDATELRSGRTRIGRRRYRGDRRHRARKASHRPR